MRSRIDDVKDRDDDNEEGEIGTGMEGLNLQDNTNLKEGVTRKINRIVDRRIKRMLPEYQYIEREVLTTMSQRYGRSLVLKNIHVPPGVSFQKAIATLVGEERIVLKNTIIEKVGKWNKLSLNGTNYLVTNLMITYQTKTEKIQAFKKLIEMIRSGFPQSTTNIQNKEKYIKQILLEEAIEPINSESSKHFKEILHALKNNTIIAKYEIKYSSNRPSIRIKFQMTQQWVNIDPKLLAEFIKKSAYQLMNK